MSGKASPDPGSDARASTQRTPTPPPVGPPVTVGPITVANFGGIPLIGIKGSIRQYSGRRLSAMIMAAATQADLTIEIPDEE